MSASYVTWYFLLMLTVIIKFYHAIKLFSSQHVILLTRFTSTFVTTLTWYFITVKVWRSKNMYHWMDEWINNFFLSASWLLLFLSPAEIGFDNLQDWFINKSKTKYTGITIYNDAITRRSSDIWEAETILHVCSIRNSLSKNLQIVFLSSNRFYIATPRWMLLSHWKWF